jgi:hypothetical protein
MVDLELQDIECAPPPAEEADLLWWTLRPDDDGVVLGLTLYLDDSGSDDGSALVSIGGPAMSRIQLRSFSTRWNKMLLTHGITPPLHMKDFFGYGKYVTKYPEMKRALFNDVCDLVNSHKLYSLSVSVSQADFRNELAEPVRKTLIGPYAFSFFVAVTAHQGMSMRLQTGPLKCSYVVDTGFAHSDQLIEAHRVVVDIERHSGNRHTGALDFTSDDLTPPLQAADAIAWASRKRQLGGSLPDGVEPLEGLLQLPAHAHIRLPASGIRELSVPVNRWISRKGSIPALGDIISL